jgi:hypothetical protein
MLRTSTAALEASFLLCSALYLSGRSVMKLPLLPVSTCELTSAGFVVARLSVSSEDVAVIVRPLWMHLVRLVVPLVITGRLFSLSLGTWMNRLPAFDSVLSTAQQ